MMFGLQGDPLELVPRWTGNSVVVGQTLVEHRELGIDQVQRTQVLSKNLGEKVLGLPAHVGFQPVVEIRVVIRIHGDPVEPPTDSATDP